MHLTFTRFRCLALFFFLFTSLAFQNPATQSHGPTELLKITVEEGPSRHLLFLSGQELWVDLCGLKKGTRYRLQANPANGPQVWTPQIDGPEGATTKGEGGLEFLATRSCQVVRIFVPGKTTLDRAPVYLTVSPDDWSAAAAAQKVLAPISTNSNFPASHLIQNVFIGGDCYEVSNITATGNTLSRGTFTNGATSLGFNDGIVLSSGNIANATGPNNQTGASTDFPVNGTDPDLAMITGGSLNDVAVIQFDFTPSADLVEFEYVFASEEYCDYVGSVFNDVFGFFISGPGITGPFSNNAANIAVLPNGTPVTINNVNHVSNPAYYVGNIPPGSGQLTDPDCAGHPTTTGAPVNDNQFDGFTTVLTASAQVIPCSTYHIKLAIADVGDGIFDSAVFLKANSFSTGGTAKVDATGTVQGTNIVQEGCGGGYFVFIRDGQDLSQPLTINFTVLSISTATPGLDYAALPTSITIPAGQSQYDLFVDVFADLIAEGIESIVIELDVPCQCSNPTIELLIEDPPPLLANLQDEELCASEPVTLNPGASGGVPNYSYQWSTGATSPTITVNPNTTTSYTVTVTDNCGNSTETTSTVTILPSPTADISGGGTLCENGGGGTVDLTINFTGTGPWTFTYTLDGVPQPPVTTSDNPYILTVSETGSFALTDVTSGGVGCPGTVSGNVTINETIINANPTPDPVSCNGVSDGSINLNVSGGTPGYTFQWSPAGSGQNPTGLPAGTYTVTVTDANGCTETVSTTIQDVPALSPSVNNVVDVDCNNPTGSIGISVSGGTPGYTYQWSPSGSGQNPTGLPAGTYTVTITDANGCTETATATIAEDVTPPNAAANVTGLITCSEPDITLSGTGSSTGPDFTYQWTGPGIVSGGTTLNPTVNAPGTYTLTVTNNANGCTQTATVSVAADQTPPVATATAPMLTCAVTSVTVSGTGSSTGPDFSYQWTGPGIVSGGNTLNPTVNQPGSYMLTVTNSINGCTETFNLNVGQDVTPPNAVATAPSLTCVDLQVTINGAGSSTGPNFSYQWTGPGIVSGGTSLNPVVNAAGSYTLTVTNNANGCTGTTNVNVGLDNTPPVANAGPPQQIDCTHSQVQLNGSGSASGSNIGYFWSTTNGNIVSGQNSATPTVNEPGTYVLTVTNNTNGCTAQSTVTVTEDVTPPLAVVLPAPLVDCFTPQVTLDGSNSSSGPNFTYQWAGPGIVSGQNTATPTVGQGGSYVLTVTNTNNGCTAQASVFVNENTNPPFVNAGSPQELTCTVSAVILDGSSSSGGPNFSYQWTTPNGNILSGANTPAPLVNEPGTYTLTITNLTNGCTASASTNVTVDSAVPMANAGPDMEINCISTMVSLNGTASSTGSSYTYLWTTVDGNIVSGATTQGPLVNAPGTYVLTVSNNDNGCTATSTAVVLDNTQIPQIVIAQPDEVNCYDPVVTIDASGSSSGSQFNYTWTTTNGHFVSGQFTLTPTVDAGGAYTLIIANLENFCNNTMTVIVPEDINNPNVTIAAPATVNCYNSQVTLNAGGTDTGPTFEYTWTTPDGNIVSGGNGLNPVVNSGGTYELTVLNTANNCSTTMPVTVNEDTAPPPLQIAEPGSLNCAVSDLQIQATAGGLGNLDISWTTPDGNIVSGGSSLTPTVDAPGAYNLAVTNLDNGCSDQQSTAVVQDVQQPLADAGPVDVINCYQSTVNLDGSGSDSGPNFSYQWSTTNGNIVSGANSAVAVADAPGDYVLLVVNQDNHCESTAAVSMTQDIAPPLADAGGDLVLGCASPTIALDGTGSSTGPGITYNWSTTDGNIVNGQTSNSPAVDAGGTYLLTVINTVNGCESTDQVGVVEDFALPQADAGPGVELTCTLTNYELQATATGLIDRFEYVWTTNTGNILSGQGTLNPLVNAAGTYTLIVTDTVNLCTDTTQVLITQDENLPVAIVQALDQLDCVTPAITIDGSASSQGPSIEYTWSTTNGNIVSGENTLTPTVDAGGTYVLTLLDLANDCETAASVTVMPDTLHPAIALASGGLITCAVPEVGLEAQVTNASNDLTLAWTTIDGQFVSGDDGLTPLVSSAGSYQLQVTNNLNGCVSSAAIQVGDDLALPTVDAGQPGEITCGTPTITLGGTADAGGAAYDLLWTTGDGHFLADSTTLNPVVDAPGDYLLTVTNAVNGCVEQSSVSISENTLAPLADAGLTDIINCYQMTLQLDGSGSVQGNEYEYLWTTVDGNILNGANTLTPEVDAPGAYQLLVFNQLNECESVAEVVIDEDLNYPDAEAGVPATLTCTQTDALLIGSTTAQGPGISYLWTTADGNIVGGGNSLTPTVDAPGDYQLEVLNTVNGCAATDQVSVDEDVLIPAVGVSPAADLTCVVLSVTLDGSASAQGPAYGYEWTTSGGQIVSGGNTLNPQVDAPGAYELTVTDLTNGCTASAEVMVALDDEAPLADAGNTATLTCAVTDLALNGTGSSQGNDFTYLWTTANGQIVSGANTLNPQVDAPGLYDLLVTNLVNGCTAGDQVTIGQDVQLPVVALASPDILTCATPELTIDGTASSSGPEFTYQWSTLDGHIVSGATTASPLVDAPGAYLLQIIDQSNGCQAQAEATVDQNIVQPQAEAGSAATLTCVVTDLNLSGAASGNSNNLSVVWTTVDGNILSGATTLDPMVDASGWYTLTVTDEENGCMHSDEVFVEQDIQPPLVVIAAPAVLTCAQPNVALNAQGSNSGTNFQVSWTTANGNIVSGGTGLQPTVDQPGLYTLQIINQVNGCETETSTSVLQDIAEPQVDAGDPFVLPCFEDIVYLEGSASAASGNLLIQWETNDGQIASGGNTLQAGITSGGTYNLVVTDLNNGCMAADDVDVTENEPAALDLQVFDPLCYGGTGALILGEVTGGTPPYMYSIDGGQSFYSTTAYNQMQPGNYTVLAQDANGCETPVLSAQIVEPAEVVVDLGLDVDLQFGDSYQLQALTNLLPSQISQIVWTPVESLSCSDCLDPVATPFSSTTYTVWIADEQGCSDEASIRVAVDKRPAVFIPNIFSPNGDGDNDVFLVFAKPGSVEKVRSFLVFSRWGETVYEYYNFDPNDPAYGWDGFHRGEPMNPAVFAYFAEVEFIDGRVEFFEGDVTLVR